jgi:hypothetical protein
VTLSSLSLADWTDNSNALANRYIQDAAASAGLTLAGVQLTYAINPSSSTSASICSITSLGSW